MPVIGQSTSNPANVSDDDEPSSSCSVAFLESRHSETIEGERRPPETWRMKERMKTVSVALTLCLNIGVDPPDIVKPQPCARLECWLDPMAMSQQKALEMIGAALQKQYERWQPRARYKLSLDPTVEDVKKLCMSLRRNAKDERVLFHYNGHGVPKPTKNGEIWVFNERYTQYIPLSVYDLQTWMGAPSIFVWDCNCAGLVVESFRQFAEQHEREMLTAAEYQHQKTSASQNGAQGGRKNVNEIPIVPDQHHQHDSIGLEENGAIGVSTNSASSTLISTPPTVVPNFRDCIQLGACQMDQILPMNPELPCDLFTSCLTTPIKVAVMWYILHNNLTDELPLDIIDKIPGQLSDRRTLLGELNWILTAITDTIAWNTFPRDLFQTLFRQDLLVASLFRNFLLADRIMRSYHCTPVSHPELPSAAEHPMWQAWDSVLDVCLSQLPMYIARPDALTPPIQPVPSIPLSQSSSALSEVGGCGYTHSSFFADQLTAFEVWLEYGYDHRGPPQQLPIVLQVLLSQVHRVRALELLGRFLDLGPWAVNLALSVGIFPYVLKLLQSFAKELRPLLSFIWAKILSVEPTCQGDLIKDGGHRYFLQILSDPSVTCEQKIVPAFVLASILDDYPPGQEAVMQGGYMSICMELLNECRSSLLRQWLAIGLGRLWSDFDAARWQGIRCVAYEKLFELLDDPLPEVRASAVFALGTLISNPSDQNEHAVHTDQSIAMKLVGKARGDASPLVRMELAVALHWLVINFEKQFITIAYELCEDRMRMFEERQQQLQKDRLQANGSVNHLRQSSLSIVDYATGDSWMDLPRQKSMQNLASSPSASTSPGHTVTPAASFSKLFNLSSVWISSPSTATLHGANAIHRDPVSILENRLRNLTFRGLGAWSNVYATVWRTMITLAHDPFPELASLAARIVDHVNSKAQCLRKAKSEWEDTVADLKSPQMYRRTLTVGIGRNAGPVQSPITSPSTPNVSDCVNFNSTSALRPTFVVGSPTDATGVAGSPAQVTTPVGQHSEGRSQTKLPTSKSITGLGEPAPVPLYSTIYTGPKRCMFSSGPTAQKTNETNSPRRTGRKASLIKTEFVSWCAKRFTRPILHLLTDET